MGQLSVRSYGAEGWATQESLFDFRQGKDFYALRRAQTNSAVHSASDTINTGTLGPGLKQLVHVADRSTHSSVSLLYTSSGLKQEQFYLGAYLNSAVAQLVEALRYKSEGRGFNSRWCH